MAQGEGSRWDKKDSPARYKQLLPIYTKTTLITRTLHQLDGENVIVVANSEFGQYLQPNTNRIEFKEPGSILRGIWLTQYKTNAWDGTQRVIFLLGDVVFSNAYIDVILKDENPFSFYGRLGQNKFIGKRTGELFGINVHVSMMDETRNGLLFLWKSGQMHNVPVKLWDFYHAMNNPNLLVQLDDYTDDIDSMEEYNKFFDALRLYARIDDERLQKN